MAGDEIESCTEWKVESSRTGNNSSRRTVKFWKIVIKIVKNDYYFQNDLTVEWDRFFARLIRKKKNILVYIVSLNNPPLDKGFFQIWDRDRINPPPLDKGIFSDNGSPIQLWYKKILYGAKPRFFLGGDSPPQPPKYIISIYPQQYP